MDRAGFLPTKLSGSNENCPDEGIVTYLLKLRDLGQRAIKLKEDQASGRLVIVRGPEDITLTNAGGAVSPRPYQSMTVAGIGQASGVTPRDGSPDSDWPTPDGVGCQESARVAPPVTIREAD